MNLSSHLQRFADAKYKYIRLHEGLRIEDRYVFVSNWFMRELNQLAIDQKCQIDIIRADYDKETGIPTFVLVPGRKVAELEEDDFLSKWRFEYMTTWMRSYF